VARDEFCDDIARGSEIRFVDRILFCFLTPLNNSLKIVLLLVDYIICTNYFERKKSQSNVSRI
jgi:hypothetical protein